MFSISVRTSASNKIIVTELTTRLNLGPENVIARIALTYSLSKGKKLLLSDTKDSKGKEYSKNVLFGENLSYYVALVSVSTMVSTNQIRTFHASSRCILMTAWKPFIKN